METLDEYVLRKRRARLLNPIVGDFYSAMYTFMPQPAIPNEYDAMFTRFEREAAAELERLRQMPLPTITPPGIEQPPVPFSTYQGLADYNFVRDRAAAGAVTMARNERARDADDETRRVRQRAGILFRVADSSINVPVPHNLAAAAA